MALHHVAPGEKVRLANLANVRAPGAIALVKNDGFETVQLILEAGQHISEHAVPGHCTIHCLEGSVILQTERLIELAEGDWLYLDRGEKHSVSATQPAVLLVTILFD